VLGFVGVSLPGTETGIAWSMVVLGAAIMLEARPPLPVLMVIVAFFAVFHGYAHGTELPHGDNALFYSLGFVVATGFLHLVGITAGLIHRWAWGKGALRVAGSGVSMAGFFFLWSAA
jgi:urease accessory protein